ncbi:MAG: hypothetical protein ABIQ27_00625 [Flavobacterium sp.]|uniref:hypothetical protein n=1 Tax=Flavobacterium sp. TaxID=239 RepID=UPI003267B372
MFFKKNKIWKKYVFYSPIVVFLGYALLKSGFTYCTGKGTLYLNRGTGINYFSDIDFNYKYRLYYKNYDGEHYGNFSLINPAAYYIDTVNDNTLIALVNVFGYQSKMYKGKFPSEKQLFQDFKKEKKEYIYIDDAKVGYAKFRYKGKTIELYSNKDSESPLRIESDVIGDVFTPINDSLSEIHDNVLYEDAKIKVITKYYPLLYHIEDTNNSKYQIIDVENQKVISTHD